MEGVSLFQTGFLPAGSQIGSRSVFQLRPQCFIGIIQCLIGFLLHCPGKLAVQIRQGCQWITGIPCGKCPDSRQNDRQRDAQGNFFHQGTSQRLAIR